MNDDDNSSNPQAIFNAKSPSSKWRIIALIAIIFLVLSLGFCTFLLIESSNKESAKNSANDELNVYRAELATCRETASSACNNDDSASESADRNTNNTTEKKNDGYLAINEWGIKIKISNAEKVAYSYIGSAQSWDMGRTDSFIVILVRSESLQTKTCHNEIGRVYRMESVQYQPENSTIKIIDRYGYYIIGAQDGGICSDVENDMINRIHSEVLDVNNYEAL